VAHTPEASGAQELDAAAREKLAALGYVGTQQVGYDAKKDPNDYLDGLNSLYQGITLLTEGQARAALPYIQTAYRGDPDNPLTAFYLATCWREIGDAATAMSYYRRALEIDPHGAKAWAHLALLRFKQAPAEALQLLEEGLKANPDAFVILITAGELSRDVGRTEEARRYLMRAAEVAPTRSEPWEGLAKLEERLGNPGEAAKFREKARALAPRPANSDDDEE
jgi:tetratricopeptide (TPR) repeat protein